MVNHSPIPVTFGVFIVPSSSVPELQEEGVLTVSPSGETTLNPNEKGCEISVTFSPKARVPQFSEEVSSSPLENEAIVHVSLRMIVSFTGQIDRHGHIMFHLHYE